MVSIADHPDMTSAVYLGRKATNQTNLKLSTQILEYEPRCEKTGLQGFRPGLTQTGLYSHRRWLEDLDSRELYYSYSENKGADASLFSHMQKAGFLTTRLIKLNKSLLSYFLIKQEQKLAQKQYMYCS